MLTHLQHALLGPEHGARFTRPACEDESLVPSLTGNNISLIRASTDVQV